MSPLHGINLKKWSKKELLTLLYTVIILDVGDNFLDLSNFSLFISPLFLALLLILLCFFWLQSVMQELKSLRYSLSSIMGTETSTDCKYHFLCFFGTLKLLRCSQVLFRVFSFADRIKFGCFESLRLRKLSSIHCHMD